MLHKKTHLATFVLDKKHHFLAAKEKLLEGDMASTIDILLTYYDRTYSDGLAKRDHLLPQTIPWNGTDAHACAQALVEVAGSTATR